MSNPWEDYSQSNKDSAPWEDYGKSNTSQPEKQGGFMSDVGQSFDTRMEHNLQTSHNKNISAVGKTIGYAGSVAGMGGDVIGAGVKALTPDSVQESIGNKFKQFSQTGAGKWFMGAMQAGEKTYKDFKKKHPEIALDFEAGLNIASILPFGKATEATAKGAVAAGRTAEDIAMAALKKTPAQLEKELKDTVTAYLPKTGIKASSVKNQGAIQAFNDASTKAVKYIAENKGELGILDKDGVEILTHPKNADEFSQAVQGAKKKIWGEQIQPLLDKVGNPTFSTKPITDDLEKIIDPKGKGFSSLQRHFPDAVPEIQRLIASYKEMGEGKGLMTFEQLEPELQSINNKLKALNKGINAKLGADDQALLTVAGHLRTIEDNMVKGIEGGGDGIKEAKKTWGALKHIEDRVAGKANSIAGKKYSQGFFGQGYLGAVSTLEMIGGLATGSLPVEAMGLMTRGVATMSSMSKDPNHIIKSMFKHVGKTVEKQKVSNSFYNPNSRMFGNKDAQGFVQSVKEGTVSGATATALQTGNPERTKEWGNE